MTALYDLTVAEASALIAARALSPVELVSAFLDRIAAVDGAVHSYVALDGDRALDRARRAEREIMSAGPRTPLHGLPYGLKDNIAAVGLAMAAGSKLRLGLMPTADAAVQTQLAQAGAILLGKLHTYEYGTGVGNELFELPFEPARNPWNLDHFTGGSSTGCGAAVAAGTAMFALGADTGGSVRLPAAGCGVAGLKPTYGLVSRDGVLPNCHSLDHVGPLAQTAQDIAAILPAIAGQDPAAGAYAKNLHAGVRGLRLGVIRTLHAFDDAETMAAFAQTLTVLRDLGADLVEIDLGPTQSDFMQCMRLINMSECFAIHRRDLRERRREMGPALRNKLLGGALVSASDYIDAQRAREKMTAALDRAIQPFHAVLLPTAPPAPRLDEAQAIADMTTLGATAPFNLSGHPALSLCNGFTAQGLPTSLQIVSRRFAEADLLRVAVAYETATAWRSRRAPCAPASQIRTPPAAAPPVSEADRAVALDLARVAGLDAVTENDLHMLVTQRRRIDAMAASMRAHLIPEDEPPWAADAWRERIRLN